MLKRPIPSSGELLPVIGLGTYKVFDVGRGEAERAPLIEVLRVLTEAGGSVVDSSPMYGAAEEVVGDLAARAKLQKGLFLATKVWTRGRGEGIAQMERSEKLLRTRAIDLMQVHNLVDVDIHLQTLAGWKEKGRVRYVGVTHAATSEHGQVMQVLSANRLDFVQINYSLGEPEAERRLLPLAQERGIAVIVNRPFAGGNLFRTLRERPLPGWAAEIDATSWAQVMLKWVLSHPGVTCAIPATSKPEHMRDNVRAGFGRLPDAALRARILKELT